MADGKSDLSGTQFNVDGETSATVLFPDGERHKIRITEAEAATIKNNGIRITPFWARIIHNRFIRGATKWLAVAVAGAIVAQLVSYSFTRQQLEVEIESDLVTETSQAVLKVYEEAQSASRTTDGSRQDARDAAADTWVETTHGSLTPRFEFYYGPESDVTRNWYAFQSAVYQWAVLACCTNDEASRQKDVNGIRAYVEDFTVQTQVLSDADWMSLVVNEIPPSGAYQRVGLALLRGRGSLMIELREAPAKLDAGWPWPFAGWIAARQ